MKIDELIEQLEVARNDASWATQSISRTIREQGDAPKRMEVHDIGCKVWLHDLNVIEGAMKVIPQREDVAYDKFRSRYLDFVKEQDPDVLEPPVRGMDSAPIHSIQQFIRSQIREFEGFLDSSEQAYVSMGSANPVGAIATWLIAELEAMEFEKHKPDPDQYTSKDNMGIF